VAEQVAWRVQYYGSVKLAVIARNSPAAADRAGHSEIDVAGQQQRRLLVGRSGKPGCAR
jgi:hypothetical protein